MDNRLENQSEIDPPGISPIFLVNRSPINPPEGSPALLVKTLALASLLTNNVQFTRYLLVELQNAPSTNHDCDKGMALALQIMSQYAMDGYDTDLSTDKSIKDRSIGNISVVFDDDYELICEKIHVNLYLRLARENNKLAILLLMCYNGNSIKLRQSILFCLIKGGLTLDQFTDITDKLLAIELDLNSKGVTYDGQETTPYDYALSRGRMDICEYLVSHGAKPL